MSNQEDYKFSIDGSTKTLILENQNAYDLTMSLIKDPSFKGEMITYEFIGSVASELFKQMSPPQFNEIESDPTVSNIMWSIGFAEGSIGAELAKKFAEDTGLKVEFLIKSE